MRYVLSWPENDYAGGQWTLGEMMRSIIAEMLLHDPSRRSIQAKNVVGSILHGGFEWVRRQLNTKPYSGNENNMASRIKAAVKEHGGKLICYVKTRDDVTEGYVQIHYLVEHLK